MKKVLILEDEVSIRSFVVINLKRAGYEAIEAGTGMEALERRGQSRPMEPYAYESGDAAFDAAAAALRELLV